MNFVTKEPINKGWSSDKKYCVTDENGTRYLLRVSDIAQHDTKQSEFNMMKQVASFGVPMCQPIEFGTCDEGVYSIQSWIDGDDAEEIMSAQSDTEQYVYGLEAGRQAAHAFAELDNAADKEEVDGVDHDSDKRTERKADRCVAVGEGFDKACAGEEAAGVDHTGNAADYEDNDRDNKVDDLAFRIAVFGVIRFLGAVLARGEEVAV